MINWRTTLFGFLAAIGLLLPTVVPNNKTVRDISGIVAAIGAAGTGAIAKDKDVTGAGPTAHKVE